jgi:predicted phosphodiesterase
VQRVAVLYDIHANLPALEAVVAEAERENIDAFVFGGDIIPGPMPRETIAFVRGLDTSAQFIHGNGDRDMIERFRGGSGAVVPGAYVAAMQWNAEQLTESDVEWIARWPPTLTLTIDGIGDVLVCHATGRNDTEIFTRLTPDDRGAAMFEAVTAPLVVCGHTHIRMDRTLGRMRIVNPGSVGMPFGETGAHWLLLGAGVEFRHTRYDLAAAAARIRSTRFPLAEQFAAANVISPPSEAAMLAAYSR